MLLILVQTLFRWFIMYLVVGGDFLNFCGYESKFINYFPGCIWYMIYGYIFKIKSDLIFELIIWLNIKIPYKYYL